MITITANTWYYILILKHSKKKNIYQRGRLNGFVALLHQKLWNMIDEHATLKRIANKIISIMEQYV